jgi:hypothetical protein
MSATRRLLASCSGVTALEFALIAPVLMLLTFGAIEVVIALFDMHRMGDATRAAARAAAVSPMIPDPARVADGPVVCNGSGSSASCGGSIANGASFSTILAAAQRSMPALTGGNLRLTYRDSGALAGSIPAGAAITPAITVELVGVVRQSFFLATFLPGAASTYTLPGSATTVMGASIPL